MDPISIDKDLWAALQKEPDPELFLSGLLVLAGRLRGKGDAQGALALYQKAFDHPQATPEWRRQAQTGIDALLGGGSFGGRAEFLTSQFVQQATDYRTIVPMLAGSAAFHLTRAAALGRLVGGGGLFSRGWMARTAANLGGFAVEVPTFSLLSRGLLDLSGENISWDHQALSKDLATSALSLGALKSFASLGGRAYSLAQGRGGEYLRGAFSQGSAFSGMLFAHHLEAEMGLRPKVDGETAAIDTLAALLALNVGGRLGRRALGPRFAVLESELQLRSEARSQDWDFSFAPRPLAMAMGGDGKKGSGGEEPFYISWDRIRSGSLTPISAPKTEQIPFRDLVQRNNLFGLRVQELKFSGPEKRFMLGARGDAVRQFKTLHDSEKGNPDAVLVSNRSGYLHLRKKVLDEAERLPDYMNLFRNGAIQMKQALLEERDGKIYLGNLTRGELVWVLDKGKWQAVGELKKVEVQDGSWIVLGQNPTQLRENILDPSERTVLRLEYHFAKPLKQPRWSLIEFETWDPAALARLPSREAHVGALLGQTPDFVAWRFRGLFEALEAGGWKEAEARVLTEQIFHLSPVTSESNLIQLTEVVGAAHRAGWTPGQLRALLSQERVAAKNGLTFLSRLPKLLASGAEAKIPAAELSALLELAAKHEKHFLRSLDELPNLLSAWRNSSKNPPLRQLTDFLGRTEVSAETLGAIFSRLPGGERVFLETLDRLIPQLQEKYGYRGETLTELSGEILARIAQSSPDRMLSAENIEAVLQSLPIALRHLFGERFGYQEQRQILLKLAEEQGTNFSEWWRAQENGGKSATNSRSLFDTYLAGSPVPPLLLLGLSLFGLHELSPEAFRSVSSSVFLGASLFFAGTKGNRNMSPTFALPERLRAAFSHGTDKVERLLVIGRRMENEGYFREARERYETALGLALKNLDGLSIRDPENRGRAGEAHRAAGTAYFDLAGFWDRRLAGRDLMLDYYRSALQHLEPLGQKRLLDMFFIENAKSRLQVLNLEEARHWASMGDAERSAKHFEAAGDFSTKQADRLNYWGKALRAYAEAQSPTLSDFARLMQKIRG